MRPRSSALRFSNVFGSLAAPGLALAAALTAASTAAAAPPVYTMVDLGAVPDKVAAGFHGINNSGLVAGSAGAAGELPESARPVLFSAGGSVELSVPPPLTGRATDVNGSGTVVGNVRGAEGPTRAMQWTPGGAPGGAGAALADLPDSLGSAAYGINDAGLVAGYSFFNNGPGETVSRATLWNAGAVTDLGTLGGASSQALAVNSAGLITGVSTNAAGASRATLWQNGAAADLGVLAGGDRSAASAINDLGWIVGSSTVSASLSAPDHATLWRDGAVIDLSLPGWAGSRATGINSAGDIIGTYRTENDPSARAFLYTGGVTYEFASLLAPGSGVDGVETFEFTGINDAGWFAGKVSQGGVFRGVLFTPVPEPAAAGLALLGLAGAGALRRRRGGPALRSPAKR